MRSTLMGLIAAAALAASPGAGWAAQPGLPSANAEAQAIFHEVMSPFCPGLTLADCPSPNAFELRRQIEARLEKGESRDAILDELVSRYGARILADPSGTPAGAIAWGVPFVLSGLAALVLALFLRRATRAAHEEPPVAVAGPPGLRARLDDELERLD